MLVHSLSTVFDTFSHMRHNSLLMNLYFILGAFSFYKCWHLFQQQQVIHFWILSHLKLLELLNSQGQHRVMFLTEKSYFVFHQKKIHVNAILPNDHFILSHLIIYFIFTSECIFFSCNADILCCIWGILSLYRTIIDHFFSILKGMKSFENCMDLFIIHIIPSHSCVCGLYHLSSMHWSCPGSATEKWSFWSFLFFKSLFHLPAFKTICIFHS